MIDGMSREASDYIGGKFIRLTGEGMQTRDPAEPGRVVWSGTPRVDHVDLAVEAARKAQVAWARMPVEYRERLLRAWGAVTSRNVERIAGLITDEMGKTLAESTAEAKLLAEKVELVLSGAGRMRVQEFEVSAGATRSGVCRFKPHGVMGVIGPFNFPAHLANGHWVPALLMGNAVVFKPSEKTAGVGQLMGELMDEAVRESGAPAGVFNVVQGGAETARRLVGHEGVNGILFTGSWPVGRSILEANVDRPGRMVALEMGGNNAAVVMNDAHVKQAVIECVRSAFATSGQRCTCTRRILVQEEIAKPFIAAFCKAASTVQVGPGRSATPVFMGPVVSEAAMNAALKFQDSLEQAGGRVLVRMTRMDRPGWFVTCGVVQVERFTRSQDCEVFGPVVQMCVVKNLDEAIEQANATEFGLAAAIFTARKEAADEFLLRVNSGCINWNTGTAGASSKLPFGGVGKSGNHRPAGVFSADCCAYPVANMVERSAEAALPAGMMWDDQWVSGR